MSESLCSSCGYVLDGLPAAAAGRVCPECGTVNQYEPVRAHWLYERRWSIAVGLDVCAAVVWGTIIATASDGWAQLGMVVMYSAMPAVIVGLATGTLTAVGGRLLTPMGARRMAMITGWRLLAEVVLISTGSAGLGTFFCYTAGGVALSLWGRGGC